MQAQNMEEETELYLTEAPCSTGSFIRACQLLSSNSSDHGWQISNTEAQIADNECINQLPCFLTKLKGTEFAEHWRAIFKYAQALGGYTANIFWCNEYIMITHICILHIYIRAAYVRFFGFFWWSLRSHSRKTSHYSAYSKLITAYQVAGPAVRVSV